MDGFLPGLPAEALAERLGRMPGNEMKSGKFGGPESSQALAVNGFGRFVDAAADLPPMPGVPAGRARAVEVAACLPLPWTGGRQPWAEALIETDTTLIAVLSRRYEPYRPAKAGDFSDIRERSAWEAKMAGFTALRRAVAKGSLAYGHLDAVGLVKAGYGLSNLAEKRGRGAVLVYLFAEPDHWANGKPVGMEKMAEHRREVLDFAEWVRGDGVTFVPLRWPDLLASWDRVPGLRAHVAAMRLRFGDLG